MSQRDWTTTMTAVAVGVIAGIVGLLVLAAVLSSTGRTGGEWVGTAALGLAILGGVELNNLRKKRRNTRAFAEPPRRR